MRPSPSKSTSASAEPEHVASGRGQPQPARDVAIDRLLVGKSLKGDRRAIEEVGHDQVAQTVVVQVACGDPHAGDGLPLAVAGHAGRFADLLESQVALVGEQPAGRPVVGDVDVGSVVTRQLGDQHAQAPAFARVDSGPERRRR